MKKKSSFQLTRSEKKEQSRINIILAAAYLFRKQGFQATGIDEIMEKATLTAGTFYTHFKSKEMLFLEVLKISLNENKSLLISNISGSPGKKIKVIKDRYLSIWHRDHSEKGCPLVALAEEISRLGPKSTHIVEEYIEEFLEILKQQNLSREVAVKTISQMMGGLLMARLLKGSELSNEFLEQNKK